MIEHIRLSEKAKQQLIVIKRKTGIENWNVLCRWALFLSLLENSAPPHEDIVADSSVEMSWKVFSGEYSDLITALLKSKFLIDSSSCDNENISNFFKLHLHRGISYLSNNIDSIDSIYKLGMTR